MISQPAEMTNTEQATVKALETEKYFLAFNAERNARYHAARRGFFDWIYRTTLFFIVALGTAGVVHGIVALGMPSATSSGIAAILGALSLVFNPYNKAQLHETLQRRSFELAAEIDAVVSATPENLAQWRSKLNLLYADEPPPMRALGAVVYNATLASRQEKPDAEMLVLKLRHVLLKQFFSFANAHFPRRGEVAKSKSA